MKGRADFNNISIIVVVSQLGKKNTDVQFFPELVVIANVSFSTVESKVPVGHYMLFFLFGIYNNFTHYAKIKC